jgi:predicted small secreted protein
MAFTREYIKFLNPEVRVSKGQIRPRNIYRISTYRTGVPPTKTGDETRYVFVIGKMGNKIHCIKLNNIRPLHFIEFINKLRDKRVPIKKNQPLDELLKLFAKDGNSLFESYVKTNPKVYSNKLDNYRTYTLENITNIWEIRFEESFLKNLFKENTPTVSNIKEKIDKEITDNDE